MTTIVGIDPGVTGALACFYNGTLADLDDMPVEASRVNGWGVATLLNEWDPQVVYLEWTQPMPKNGSIASYSLGLNSGIVIGVVQALGISLERVRPNAWKLAMGLRGKPKAASRGMASELFPDFADQFRRVKDDGRAEAALIARYGAYRNIQTAMTGVEENEEIASVSDLQGRDRHPSGSNARAGA
jgi:crossover junction endodeoxyribonuclease RuvC